MNSLADGAALEARVTRLGKLHPDRPRAWGRMTPNEMLCHLSDSLAVALGERPFAPAETWLQRNIFKWVAPREEWLIRGYRHTDHHLRQFAL